MRAPRSRRTGRARFGALSGALPGTLIGALLCVVLCRSARAMPGQDALAEARALRLAGRPAEAADRLASALAASPGEQRLLGLYGLCLLDAGRNAEAVSLAARVGEYRGDDPRLHTALGRVHHLQGNDEAAVHDFRRALAIKPDAIEPCVELVGVLIAQDRFGAAQAAAEALEEHEPEMGRRLGAAALAALARKHHAIGEESLGPAIDAYRAALAKTPDDKLIAQQLVECLLTTIRVDEARELIERTFTGPELQVERLYYLGRCEDALCDTVRARAVYETALAIDPAHAPTLLELAKLDLDDGDAAACRQRLALVTEQDGGARLCLLSGLAELELGNDASAEAALRRALRIEPGNTKAAYHLGRLLVRTGRTAEGRELLGRVAAAQR